MMMNNDLTGTQGTSPKGDAFSPLSQEMTTQKTEAIDLQTYIDTMSNIAFVPQQFFVKTVYEASAQNPMLLQPDTEGEFGPQPYGIAEQKLIMKFINKRVKELLAKQDLSEDDAKVVYQAIISGKPLSNVSLANLAMAIRNQVKQETGKSAHLPESWNPQSADPKDWIPLPIQPYNASKQSEINQYYDATLKKAYSKTIAEAIPPMSQELIDKLKNALATGKTSPIIAKAYHVITKAAAEATQKAYGLSETWCRGTTNIDDWKPINLGIMTPTAVNQARGELILTNLNEILTDFDKAGKKVAEGLDSNDPHQVSMDEYRKVIAKAIQELKAVLRNIQLKDADESLRWAEAKFIALEERQTRLEDDLKKRKEIEEKRKKAEKISGVMKIAGPCVAAASVIVGASLAIFTFGASTALIVAGIAIGTAMTAYSIVDSFTGSTQKAIGLFNDLIKKALPDNPLGQKLLKAAIIAAVVAALIMAIVFSGGGAAGSLASNTLAQTAKEVAQQLVKQFSIQMIMMTIMASNAIPELFGEILKTAGVNESQVKIWEIVMMAITMVAVMAAMAVGSSGGASVKGISEGFSSAARSAKDFASAATKLLDKLIMDITEGITEAIEATIKMLKQALKVLMDALNNLKTMVQELPKTLHDAMKQSIQRVKDITQELIDLIQDPGRLKLVAGDTFRTVTDKFNDAIKKLSDAISEVYRTVKSPVEKGVGVTLEELEKAIKKVHELTSAAITKLLDIPGGLGSWAKDFRETANVIGRGLKGFKDSVVNFTAWGALRYSNTGTPAEIAKLQALWDSVGGNLQRFGVVSHKVLQVTPMVINAVDGVNRGLLGLQVKTLLEEIGDNKEAEELLQAIILMLEKLMKTIQSGLETRSDLILTLQRAYNSFYNALGRNTTKIFQTLQV
jgi:invasin B